MNKISVPVIALSQNLHLKPNVSINCQQILSKININAAQVFKVKFV